jgi:hypothetical protein
VVALTVGAFGPIVVAGSFWWRENVVRSYTGVVPAEEEVDDSSKPTTEVPAGQPTSGST